MHRLARACRRRISDDRSIRRLRCGLTRLLLSARRAAAAARLVLALALALPFLLLPARCLCNVAATIINRHRLTGLVRACGRCLAAHSGACAGAGLGASCRVEPASLRLGRARRGRFLLRPAHRLSRAAAGAVCVRRLAAGAWPYAARLRSFAVCVVRVHRLAAGAWPRDAWLRHLLGDAHACAGASFTCCINADRLGLICGGRGQLRRRDERRALFALGAVRAQARLNPLAAAAARLAAGRASRGPAAAGGLAGPIGRIAGRSSICKPLIRLL